METEWIRIWLLWEVLARAPLVGMMVGLVPLVTGGVKGRLAPGVIGFFACAASGLALGLLLAAALAYNVPSSYLARGLAMGLVSRLALAMGLLAAAPVAVVFYRGIRRQ